MKLVFQFYSLVLQLSHFEMRRAAWNVREVTVVSPTVASKVHRAENEENFSLQNVRLHRAAF